MKLTEGATNPMTGEPINKDNYDMGQLGNLDAREAVQRRFYR